MKRVVLGILLLSSAMIIPVNSESQLQVVQRVRGKYPNLPGNKSITVIALKEIAKDSSIRGGLLKKTSGNNCNGYSCDIICYQDKRYFDVFVDWETTARAAWNAKVSSTVLGDRCEMQSSETPTPEPPKPPTTDCSAQEQKIKELTAANAKLVTENTRLDDQLKEWDKRLNTCLKEKEALQIKYDNVTCKASVLGIHVPCTVVK